MYYGGVQHEIRKEVWPFLLGHYKFGMNKKDMSQVTHTHTSPVHMCCYGVSVCLSVPERPLECMYMLNRMYVRKFI